MDVVKLTEQTFLHKNMTQDLRQSDEWAGYMKAIGWEVESFGRSKAYIRKIPLLGSLIKIPRPNPPLSYSEIDKVAKKYKALLVKIEPNLALPAGRQVSHPRGVNTNLKLTGNGYFEDNWAFAPTRTIRIDLKKSLEEILSKMEKETRYSIRLAQSKRLKVKSLEKRESLEKFIEIYKQTAKRAHFWTGPLSELKLRWESFNKAKKGEIFLAFSEKDELLAGAMVFHHDKTSYYYHAASTLEGRKMGAPSLIVWEIINKAKHEGCLILDLEGIKDPRIPSTKNWEGFSNFKRSFGGEEVEYIGSFSKYYVPLIGPVFRLIQRLGV